MTISEYLSKLGWDANKWTVLKDEEWQPLTKVSGYQNNMFDAVKDPDGRKEYGKNARIVERNWMNKNMAAVANASLPDAPTVEATEDIPLPPPPAVAKAEDVPPVPAALKEIAKASPNIVIATIPKEEPAMEWPDFVVTRAEKLLSLEWKMFQDKNDMIHSPDGKIVLGYEDLEQMENAEWKALITPKKSQEEIEKEEAKAKKELGLKRIAILVNNGCTAHMDGDEVIGIDFPDGEAYGINRIAEMDSEEWMPVTVKYSAKGVKDMIQAKKAPEALKSKIEADKIKADEELASAEKIKAAQAEAKAKREAVQKAADAKKEEALAAAKRHEDEVNREPEKEPVVSKKEITHGPNEGKGQPGNFPEEQPGDLPDDKDAGYDAEEDYVGKYPEDLKSHAFKMTTGDTGGIFDALAKVGFGQPKLSLNLLPNGKYKVYFEMHQDEVDYELALQLMKEGSEFKKSK